MIDPVEALFDTLYRMNPVARWFATFFIIFCTTFLIYIIFATPFSMLGWIPVGAVIGGAVGCGIGTALVNATLFLLS